VVVVGASLAGLRAAEELRHEGHRGPVIIVGDEDHPPYDRPPLSKQFLAGKWDVERIHHHTPDKLDALGLELRLGRRAVSLDTTAHTVTCDDGGQLTYDGLIVATGASARRLPGTEAMPGVHTLRTLDDCLALRAILGSAGEAARVVVIGAGFIGSEVAATCHGLGATVTVVEALPTPLARVLGEQMGAVCAGLHRAAGVSLRTGVGVERVSASPEGGTGSTRSEVHLDDGTVLEADLVVVGIGVVPNVGWLEDAGLLVDDGVVCDSQLFAADGVVAAGDVARWHHPSLDEQLRVEHWTNAAEGGAAAARNLVAGTDAATPYDPVPFFWSDQYQTKIQFVGRTGPDVAVVDGSLDDDRFAVAYGSQGRLVGALSFNRPARLMALRKMIDRGDPFPAAG
jgi:3-phenylpropionate/trans-cinnamate dioxygenase ferredoxin reductase component